MESQDQLRLAERIGYQVTIRYGWLQFRLSLLNALFAFNAAASLALSLVLLLAPGNAAIGVPLSLFVTGTLCALWCYSANARHLMALTGNADSKPREVVVAWWLTVSALYAGALALLVLVAGRVL